MSEYIKKEDARAAINKHIDDGSEYNCTEREWYQQGLMEADLAIIELPSADVVEVRHGKWIKAADDGERSFYVECDQCHKVTPNGWNMNYCPNCGAKMDGEEQEHE